MIYLKHVNMLLKETVEVSLISDSTSYFMII